MRWIKQRGITLLEMMLALAVAGSAILLGIKQYQAYEVQRQLEQLSSNVEFVFQALGRYYQANCIQNKDYFTGNALTGSVGALDPSISHNPALSSSVAIDISSQLITPGYLSAQSLVGMASILDTSVGYNGIVAQFNRVQATRQSATTQNGNVNVGTIYFWQAQVAVKLNDSSKAASYLNIVGADCISSASGSTVTPCTQSPSANSYLVWQRLPSFALSTIASDSWPSNTLLKQFKYQYTHDSFYEINTPSTAPYYLCGG